MEYHLYYLSPIELRVISSQYGLIYLLQKQTDLNLM